MIYFDNAATTFPKPKSVGNEMLRCINRYCGNPGRSSHKLSLEAAKKIYECRSEISSLFSSENPENVIFTYNTTYALNMAIKGTVKSGDHILISDLEHNSVLRPVYALKTSGKATFDIFNASCGDDDKTISNIKNLIRPNTRVLICTHASNVCGIKLPIKKIGELCKKHNIIFILDAAQSAGIYDINLEEMNIDILCAPGHKGLYGPQGSGFLIISEKTKCSTLIEGGNGVNSLEADMPDFLPEGMEAGTLSTPCIAGLCEGVKYIKSVGLEEIRYRETALGRRLNEVLQNTDGIEVFAKDFPESNTVLFNAVGIRPEVISSECDKSNICLRSGFHCSPLAHRALGTGKNGAVRASFGLFNKPDEIDLFCKRLKEIMFISK